MRHFTCGRACKLPVAGGESSSDKCGDEKQNVAQARMTHHSLPRSVLFQKDPLHMLRQAIDIRVHGGRVNSKIVKPSFAFAKTIAVDLDLE